MRELDLDFPMAMVTSLAAFLGKHCSQQPSQRALGCSMIVQVAFCLRCSRGVPFTALSCTWLMYCLCSCKVIRPVRKGPCLTHLPFEYCLSGQWHLLTCVLIVTYAEFILLNKCSTSPPPIKLIVLWQGWYREAKLDINLTSSPEGPFLSDPEAQNTPPPSVKIRRHFFLRFYLFYSF